MGWFCANGTGIGVTKDANLAVRYYRMAADQGHHVSQYHLGLYLEKGDPFQMAAEGEHPDPVAQSWCKRHDVDV